MNKTQKFARTVGTAISVKNPRDVNSTGDDTNLNTVLAGINAYCLTDAEKKYIDDKIGDTIIAELKTKWKVTQEDVAGQQSWNADACAVHSMTRQIKVFTKLDGVLTDADGTVPAGFTRTGTGTYVSDVVYGDSTSGISGTFRKTVTSGSYSVVAEGSASCSISIKYPIWYGNVGTDNNDTFLDVPSTAAEFTALINSQGLTKSYTTVSGTSWTSSKKGRVWIITRGAKPQMDQLKSSLINDVVKTGYSLIGANSITLSGYKIYRTTQPLAGTITADYSFTC